MGLISRILSQVIAGMNGHKEEDPDVTVYSCVDKVRMG